MSLPYRQLPAISMAAETTLPKQVLSHITDGLKTSRVFGKGNLAVSVQIKNAYGQH